jgi:N-methylhydantoinase B/oxoprolinase/acetone carboxylase alpha subunit
MVERADGTRETINKRRLTLQAGDRLITTTGGGGGYGDPRRRDRAAVRRDLQEEKISERSAREVYGLESQAIPAALAAG